MEAGNIAMPLQLVSPVVTDQQNLGFILKRSFSSQDVNPFLSATLSGAT